MVTLYRYPAPDGVVVCLDELGPLRMIPRGGRSWRRQAARRPDRYRRCGAVQLWAAFAPRRGHGVGLAVGPGPGKRFWIFCGASCWRNFLAARSTRSGTI